jgi:hypothetical protein
VRSRDSDSRKPPDEAATEERDALWLPFSSIALTITIELFTLAMDDDEQVSMDGLCPDGPNMSFTAFQPVAADVLVAGADSG